MNSESENLGKLIIDFISSGETFANIVQVDVASTILFNCMNV